MSDPTGTEASLIVKSDPVIHAENIVRVSGTSFYWAMRWLPEMQRKAMYAVYAFCRQVDDVVDGCGTETVKLIALGRWRDEIERLYMGAPSMLTTKSLLCPIDKYGLAKEDFMAVIDGMEMDAGSSVRIADMSELTLYCNRVACAVGRMSTRVFGIPDELGHPLAFSEGLALQLTNILRDVVEDAQRDRLYLPADLLRAHSMTELDDLGAVLKNPQLAQACDILSGVAENHFNNALKFAAQSDTKKVRPAVMMLQVYRRILRRLQSRGWDNLDQPVSLSRLTKLWVAVRYGVM
ncbi:MAG: squalene synthase HpnD [Rhodospirillaceae bacterium TMED8]|nr:squalene synthase HpnD [Magnetovibrio sp.]OUT50252.1 MAG: squalene synthase HpnD [Rhodospirillaceae bacterium TMED8]